MLLFQEGIRPLLQKLMIYTIAQDHIKEKSIILRYSLALSEEVCLSVGITRTKYMKGVQLKPMKFKKEVELIGKQALTDRRNWNENKRMNKSSAFL